MSIDLLSMAEFKDKDQAAKVRDKYQGEVVRYTKEQAEIEEKAKDDEKESASAQHRADRYDLGEVFLEIALVISSLALLSGKRIFWLLGLASGLMGLGVAVSVFLRH
jgi:hypothetical protein